MVFSTRNKRYNECLTESSQISIQAGPAPKRIRTRKHCQSRHHGHDADPETTSQATPISLYPEKPLAVPDNECLNTRDARQTSRQQTRRRSALNSRSYKNHSRIMSEQEIEMQNDSQLGYPTPPFNEGEKIGEHEDTSNTTLRIWTCSGTQLQNSGSNSVTVSQPKPVLLCDQEGEDFKKAWTASLEHEQYRIKKYGHKIAREWKRGSTPDDAREQYAATCRALVEDISDSE